MYRIPLVLAAVGLVALATGCTMCGNPYDYCSPTYTGAPGEPCCPDARAGSILSAGTPHPTLEAEIPPEQIISVTDEKVGGASQSTSPAAARRAGTSGRWTALTPTPAAQR